MDVLLRSAPIYFPNSFLQGMDEPTLRDGYVISGPRSLLMKRVLKQLEVRLDFFRDVPDIIVPIPSFDIFPAQKRVSFQGKSGLQGLNCKGSDYRKRDIMRFIGGFDRRIYVDLQLDIYFPFSLTAEWKSEGDDLSN